ncbi:MAG: hypothetical protein K2I72_00795, partial [Bacilli bacterium]|nr:hypothetical protein [Bacilli bacterium]
IKERYKKLEKIKEKSRNELMDEFKWFIAAFFEIDKNMLDQKDSKEFVSLFGNQNFDESYIDSYSSKSMSLLDRYDTPRVVEKSILNDQRIVEEKLSEFGIDIGIDIDEEKFIEKVDGFIEKRQVEKEDYYRRILSSNFSYNRELSKCLSTKNSVILFNASFYKNPNRSWYIMSDGQKINFVFYPIVRMVNQNSKTLDADFIHELVHTVAKDGEYSIINEIVVQKAAINITKRLHENGIFIFDDKEQCLIEGQSRYEALFSVIEPILSNYYDVLKEILINGSFYSLDEVFGESWDKFLAELENIFANYEKMAKTALEGFNWNTNLSYLNGYMREIIEFYNKGGKHV